MGNWGLNHRVKIRGVKVFFLPSIQGGKFKVICSLCKKYQESSVIFLKICTIMWHQIAFKVPQIFKNFPKGRGHLPLTPLPPGRRSQTRLSGQFPLLVEDSFLSLYEKYKTQFIHYIISRQNWSWQKMDSPPNFQT